VDADKTGSIEEVIKEADQAMYEQKRRKKGERRLQRGWSGEFA
jgi:GGDEF domain-containing protein